MSALTDRRKSLHSPKNGKDRLDRIEELLHMAAAQTVENTKQIAKMAEEHDREMREMRAEHKSEMKEIRVLFREMIRRIAV